MGDPAERPPTPSERRRTAIHDALVAAPTGPWWQRTQEQGVATIIAGAALLLAGWIFRLGEWVWLGDGISILLGGLIVLVGLAMQRSARRKDSADPPSPGEDPDAES